MPKNKYFKVVISTILAISMLVCSNIIAFASENSTNSLYNTNIDSDMQEMATELVNNIPSEAISIGKPQFIKLESSDAIGTLSITHDNPLASWVTFSRSNWGAYREYDGNRIAISYKFVVPSDSSSGYKVNLALFEYGQQYFSKGSVTASNQNEVYSFTAKNITPNTQSYRFWYESNTYTNVSVYVVAVPYYV